jgi:hypothetical protein
MVTTVRRQTIKNAKGILKSFIPGNNLRLDTNGGVADVPEAVNLTGLHDIFFVREKVYWNTFQRFQLK